MRGPDGRLGYKEWEVKVKSITRMESASGMANLRYAEKTDDDYGHMLGKALTAYFLSNVVRKETISETTGLITFPEGPWQFFKFNYFPTWWLKRWPPRMRCVPSVMNITIEFVKNCPHVKIHDTTAHFKFLVKDDLDPRSYDV
jgi:hypothetical protein